mmetsp:Transcript_54393/g.109391  ORF Transcript_54393/g.109391 Transcript_54393/m.109391 type:complete len:118 (-) Transcript_54393:216-569(-)
MRIRPALPPLLLAPPRLAAAATSATAVPRGPAVSEEGEEGLLKLRWRAALLAGAEVAADTASVAERVPRFSPPAASGLGLCGGLFKERKKKERGWVESRMWVARLALACWTFTRQFS